MKDKKCVHLDNQQIAQLFTMLESDKSITDIAPFVLLHDLIEDICNVAELRDEQGNRAGFASLDVVLGVSPQDAGDRPVH